MAGDGLTGAPSPGSVEHAELLLREISHRCANDLQLVVSLLALQSRKAQHPEARAALKDAASRVAVLARARTGLSRQDHPDLGTALHQLCEALHSQAEPRGILVSVDIKDEPCNLSSHQVATLALAVNELATNAIKHAFREEQGGRISIVVERDGDGATIVTVDDDGLPLSDAAAAGDGGMGFGLVRRLVASVRGTFDKPERGTKVFRITVPE